ncbi:iron-siderophore ABC transporter substrate-binding protein [Frigidibacter sp. MR17.14]|uniref:iron-siderophore ABC transporter substrate-binding protein n=1 Tax=Frigidibacter sp. MR17.14 TaxID=3126509 RepID=UPI003012D1B3
MVSAAVRSGAVSPGPDRRALLAAAAGLMLAAALPSRARAGLRATPRLAAIDWAMLDTAVTIGHVPVAGCELIRYRAETVAPPLPDAVTDLGLRGAPNFELLQLTRPGLILSSPYYTRYEARLATLAPVLSLPFFLPGEPPLPKALDALERLAEAVDDAPAGARARAQAEASLDGHARALVPYADRPVCLVNIGDARHLRAFGFDSLFGSTLARLGLANAWEGRTRFSFLAPVPLEALAALPEARLVIVGEVPPEARRGLERSRLWRALPAVAAGRVYHLPEVNAFGGTGAALRFAALLGTALQAGPDATA